jgi:DNA-directed RNA polymerase specialized sigma24 family protein
MTMETDLQLVTKCLHGEVEAWEQLYNHCHPVLLKGIRHMLGEAGKNPDLVDEIASRVWYSLVRDDGQLLARYDAARNARLSDYCLGVARIEILRHLREQRRRQLHELALGRRVGSGPPVSEWELAAAIEEFAVTLTPGERQFMERELTAAPSRNSDQPLSQANVWQRCHRIRAKLIKFLAGE